MKKTYNVHGVELTSLQEMMFGKWCDNNGVAMNALTIPQRKAKVEEFLAQSRSLASQVINNMVERSNNA